MLLVTERPEQATPGAPRWPRPLPRRPRPFPGPARSVGSALPSVASARPAPRPAPPAAEACASSGRTGAPCRQRRARQPEEPELLPPCPRRRCRRAPRSPDCSRTSSEPPAAAPRPPIRAAAPPARPPPSAPRPGPPAPAFTLERPGQPQQGRRRRIEELSRSSREKLLQSRDRMFSKLTSILQHAVEAVRPSGARGAAGSGEGGCGEAWEPPGPLLSRWGPGGSRGLLAVNLRGYVASAAQDKRTAVPVGRACFCFRAGGRGATGTAGPGPHRYRLCQLGLGGPPRPDLGDLREFAGP